MNDMDCLLENDTKTESKWGDAGESLPERELDCTITYQSSPVLEELTHYVFLRKQIAARCRIAALTRSPVRRESPQLRRRFLDFPALESSSLVAGDRKD